MTIAEWLKGATDALASSGCPDPAIDSRWIAEDVLSASTAELRFLSQNTLEPARLIQLNQCLKRRLAGEPVQYILCRADFMGLTLYVDKRVLIPRQDTETLVEAAIVALHAGTSPKVLDLCAGSGAIGLSIATLVPNAKVTLADISQGAIEVARKNMHSLGVNATVRHGDLFNAIGHERYDIIVSNPPYIPQNELSALQTEVRFEPEIALNGGKDGLDFYRAIARDAFNHLLPGGSLYLEVGQGQAHAVLNLLTENIASTASGIIKDMCGIERVVWIKRT